MRIAQINIVPSLSTGRIAVALCRMIEKEGHRAVICHSRDYAPSDVASIRIGSKWDYHLHAALSRLTDRCGFFSKRATVRFLKELERFRPDLIHLHNVHGYYLHLPTLFEYLKKKNVPVVWTLHDCWAYTGHCSYYTLAEDAPPLEPAKRRRAQQHTLGCSRWQGGCGECVLKRSYPASWLMDQSARNWKEKRALFCGVPNMVLTTPSQWLADEVKQSFLKGYPVYAFPNGLDLSVFKPCPSEKFMDEVIKSYGLDRSGGRRIVLSVAAVWEERKGLEDLVELAEKLGDGYCVAAVGVDKHQMEALKKTKVLGVRRTGNVNDLCALYTAADLYVSASREETMGMTLVEALACGTQTVCYDATAMPEIVTEEVGEVVPAGDVEALAGAVRRLCDSPRSGADCRKRAEEYDADKRFAAYLRLYEKMYRFSPAYQDSLTRTAPPAEDEISKFHRQRRELNEKSVRRKGFRRLFHPHGKISGRP